MLLLLLKFSSRILRITLLLRTVRVYSTLQFTRRTTHSISLDIMYSCFPCAYRWAERKTERSEPKTGWSGERAWQKTMERERERNLTGSGVTEIAWSVKRLFRRSQALNPILGLSLLLHNARLPSLLGNYNRTLELVYWQRWCDRDSRVLEARS